MTTESDFFFHRMGLYHLLKEHPDWSNRRCAAHLGHSEAWVRKWRQRFRDTLTQTIGMFRGHSRRPHNSPPPITPEVKDAIGDLRHDLSRQYNRRAGPILIRAGLRQQPQLASFRLPTSTRTINRILHELGYITPPKRRVHEPLTLCAPMEEWEMDFCQLFVPEEGVFEIFLVVDAGTSRVVYVEASSGYSAETALEALARLFISHGLPQRLRMDRDPRFVGSWTRHGHPAPLLRFLRVIGVQPVVCPPRRPDLKPHVERCVKTLKEEWIVRFPWETRADLYEVLGGFGHYHNAQRLHQGRACQNRTPDEAFPVLPRLPELPTHVAPNRWMESEHGRVYRRHINSSGTIQVDQHRYYIDTKRAKQAVVVHLDAEARMFHITCAGQKIKQVPLEGVLPDEMEFQAYLRVIKAEARQVTAYRRMAWQKEGDVA
jgi:hypothetical protein